MRNLHNMGAKQISIHLIEPIIKLCNWLKNILCLNGFFTVSDTEVIKLKHVISICVDEENLNAIFLTTIDSRVYELSERKSKELLNLVPQSYLKGANQLLRIKNQ